MCIRDSFGPVQIATILCLWGLVIGAVYMLRAYRNIFQGDLSKASAYATVLQLSERAANCFLVIALAAVSYTHLDVYKRQPPSWCLRHR